MHRVLKLVTRNQKRCRHWEVPLFMPIAMLPHCCTNEQAIMLFEKQGQQQEMSWQPHLLCNVGLVADAILQHLHYGGQVGGRDDRWPLLAAVHELEDPPCANTTTSAEARQRLLAAW